MNPYHKHYTDTQNTVCFSVYYLTGQRPVPFLEAVCDRSDQTLMPRGGSYAEL